METFTTIKTIQASDLTININKHCSNLTNNWFELEVIKADEPIANFMVEESDFYDTGYNLNCYEGDCDQDLIWDSVYFPLVHLIGREQYFKTIKNLDGKAPYKVNAYTIAVAEFVKEQFDFNYIENLKDEFLDLINLDLVEDEDGKYKYLAMPWWQTGDHEGEYAIWAEVLEDNTANAAKEIEDCEEKMKEWTIRFLNEREPLVIKGDTFAEALKEYLEYDNDLSYADLCGADLNHANLSYANLSHANLTCADLSFVDLEYADLICAKLGDAKLRYADLSYADFTNAELMGADFTNSKLNYATLIGANLDYSCLPLRCDSLTIQIDKRIACQLLYHTLKVMKSVDDEEVKAILKNDKVLALANQFHRVDECGEI